MADLIRIGVVIDSSGAKRGAQEAGAALDQLGQKAQTLRARHAEANRSIDEMTDRLRVLRSEHSRGLSTNAQYGSSLRTLRADIASMGNQTRLGAEEQARLAQVSDQTAAAQRRLAAETRRVNSAVSRVGFGVSAMVGSMEGGRLSVQGLTSALLLLGAGTGVGATVITGLALIAAAYDALRRASDDAGDSAARTTTRQLLNQNRAPLQGRLASVQASLANRGATTLTPGRSGLMVRGPVMSVSDVRRLTEEEAALRTALAELDRAEADSRRQSARTSAAREEGLAKRPPSEGGSLTPFTVTDIKPFELTKGPLGFEKSVDNARHSMRLLAADAEGAEQRMMRAFQRVGDRIQEAFADVLMGQRDALRRFVQEVERDLLRLGIRRAVQGILPDIQNLLLPGQVTAPASQGRTVVQQSVTFAPGFIDAASGQAWLRAHSGTIAEIMADTVSRSSSFKASLA